MEGIDLSGKTAIITGGYSGIGLEVTRSLAEAGATVIAPSRTPDKAERALANIPRVEQRHLGSGRSRLSRRVRKELLSERPTIACAHQ